MKKNLKKVCNYPVDIIWHRVIAWCLYKLYWILNPYVSYKNIKIVQTWAGLHFDSGTTWKMYWRFINGEYDPDATAW